MNRIRRDYACPTIVLIWQARGWERPDSFAGGCAFTRPGLMAYMSDLRRCIIHATVSLVSSSGERVHPTRASSAMAIYVLQYAASTALIFRYFPCFPWKGIAVGPIGLVRQSNAMLATLTQPLAQGPFHPPQTGSLSLKSERCDHDMQHDKKKCTGHHTCC